MSLDSGFTSHGCDRMQLFREKRVSWLLQRKNLHVHPGITGLPAGVSRAARPAGTCGVMEGPVIVGEYARGEGGSQIVALATGQCTRDHRAGE